MILQLLFGQINWRCRIAYRIMERKRSSVAVNNSWVFIVEVAKNVIFLDLQYAVQFGILNGTGCHLQSQLLMLLHSRSQKDDIFKDRAQM